MRHKAKDLGINWVVVLGFFVWSVHYQLPPPCYPYFYFCFYFFIYYFSFLSLPKYHSIYLSIYHYLHLSIYQSILYRRRPRSQYQFCSSGNALWPNAFHISFKSICSLPLFRLYVKNSRRNVAYLLRKPFNGISRNRNKQNKLEERGRFFSRRNQCDQIGQFIWLWATFQSLWQRLICLNL